MITIYTTPSFKDAFTTYQKKKKKAQSSWLNLNPELVAHKPIPVLLSFPFICTHVELIWHLISPNFNQHSHDETT